MTSNIPKYTYDGLPTLTREVIDVYFRDFNQRGIEGGDSSVVNYGDIAERRAFEENPNLAYLVERLSDESKIPEEIHHKLKPILHLIVRGMHTAIIALYEIMRRQAEVNNLENPTKQGSPPK